jgi:hypothetical protein
MIAINSPKLVLMSAVETPRNITRSDVEIVSNTASDVIHQIVIVIEARTSARVARDDNSTQRLKTA